MAFTLKKSDLNFRVYTATETPGTGNENDIVIISATPMKNWILSPDAPSGTPRNDGDVWLRYSVAEETRNILRQNAVFVAVSYVYQYVNGAWVEATAKSYRNGAWVGLWNGVLYENGYEYTGVTGGWYIPYNNGGTLTKNESNMVMSSGTDQTAFGVNNDLNGKYEGYSKINIKVSSFTKSSSGFFAVLFHNNAVYPNGSNHSLHKVSDAVSAATVYSYDIPANSPKYPFIVVCNGTLTVEKIWFE